MALQIRRPGRGRPVEEVNDDRRFNRAGDSQSTGGFNRRFAEAERHHHCQHQRSGRTLSCPSRLTQGTLWVECLPATPQPGPRRSPTLGVTRCRPGGRPSAQHPQAGPRLAGRTTLALRSGQARILGSQKDPTSTDSSSDRATVCIPHQKHGSTAFSARSATGEI